MEEERIKEVERYLEYPESVKDILEFVIAAKRDLPELVEEIRRLQKELAAKCADLDRSVSFYRKKEVEYQNLVNELLEEFGSAKTSLIGEMSSNQTKDLAEFKKEIDEYKTRFKKLFG